MQSIRTLKLSCMSCTIGLMREILNIISNADHLEPLVCAKTHLPFQNHSSQQIDKGRERERERERESFI